MLTYWRVLCHLSRRTRCTRWPPSQRASRAKRRPWRRTSSTWTSRSHSPAMTRGKRKKICRSQIIFQISCSWCFSQTHVMPTFFHPIRKNLLKNIFFLSSFVINLNNKWELVYAANTTIPEGSILKISGAITDLNAGYTGQVGQQWNIINLR